MSKQLNRVRSPRMSRRDLLKTSLAGLTAFQLPGLLRSKLHAASPSASPRGLKIETIDRKTVKLPFRKVPARAMAREIPHWQYSEVCEVTLACGKTGFGETLLFYTWGKTEDPDVERALGTNAAELMWDDSLGAGLQMALFDAVAKANDVPVHRLLGRQLVERTPLSWWNIDTHPKDMASECAEAYRQGYRSYKTKGRPWFDVWKQVELAAAEVPESFKIDMDFNDTLRDAKRAIPLLKDLDRFPQIDIYESPIPQADVPGNRAIREATRANIAMHYGTPTPAVAIKEQVCDGFVIGGGATRVMQQAAVARMADMPFWLQLVGTGITAAFSLHFGAVLSHAKWPAVNCHQLFTHSLLTESIRVVEGTAAIPDRPGLGYELDRAAIDRFRVEKPQQRPKEPRLVEIRWPDGRKLHVGSGDAVNFVLDAANRETIPFFERGVSADLIPNDGTRAWRNLYDRAVKKPVWSNR